MRNRSSLLAAAAFAATLGLALPAWCQDLTPPGDAGAGKRVYLADGCFECHGRVGQGGAYLGPAPVLARTELPFDAFKQQLREPSNNMPPYAAAVMSDAEVADVFAYLRSLPGRREAKDLPAMLTH